MTLVSVVVPVYNVASHLVECLDSIISQSYDKIEIILINDGSTDASSGICKAYAKKDSRIKYVDKANGGVSSARNHGLDVAQGEYVTFVDSDDVLMPYYVESMLRLVVVNDADVACFNILQWDPKKGIEVAFPGTRNSLNAITMSPDTAIENMLRNRFITAGPYAKLIRREVIDAERFSKLVIAEDLEFNVRVFNKAEKIVYCDSDIYKYRQTNSGAMRRRFTPSHMDAITATDSILRDAINYKRSYVKAAKYRLMRAAMYCAGGMIHSGQKLKYRQLYGRCRSIIRRQALSIATDSGAALRMRVIAVLAAINTPLAWRVMTGWHKINVWSQSRGTSSS